jgi:dual specificity phosphatase 12
MYALTLKSQRFIKYQIPLDDTESADLLVYLPPAIAFIQAALESGKGILAHCQAGMSAY